MDMDAPELIAKLESEKAEMERVLSRFVSTPNATTIHRDDERAYRQQIYELRDLLADEGLIQYSHQIVGFFSQGIANQFASPSSASVERIIAVLGAAIARVQRNPEILKKRQSVQETVAETSRVSEIPLATLHPEICAKCEKLYRDGSYSEAVEKSFKIVRDRLREHTGYETGAKAFGRGNAKGKSLYVKGAAAPNVDESFNEAVKFLTMAIDKFRNEKSHTSDAKIEDPVRAYEYLRVASLALHLLDHAELVDRWPWETSGT